MNILHYAGRLYSLDTLDTRFTTSPKRSASQIDTAIPSLKEGRKSRNGPDTAARCGSPSRWSTPEFMIYGLVILVAIPWMFKTVYDVSQRKPSCAQRCQSTMCAKDPVLRSMCSNPPKLLKIRALAINRLDSWPKSRQLGPAICELQEQCTISLRRVNVASSAAKTI